MYYIVKIIEKIYLYLYMISKKIMWKIKYGKNIQIGKHVTFRKNFYINMTKNARLIIGDNVFFNSFCSINCHDQIIIGNNTQFGQNVYLFDHDHDYGFDLSKKFFKTEKINIGSNCWIGANTIILKGSNIGNNTIIGCSSVIKEKIDNDVVYIQKRQKYVKKRK